MKSYVYAAKTVSGVLKEGVVRSATLEGAARQVMLSGLSLLRLNESNEENGRRYSLFRFDRISRRDIIFFTRQLAGLTGCHVAVVVALKLMANRCRKNTLSILIGEIERKVSDGQSLSAVLQHYPKHFSQPYVHMVLAGELSGQMGNVLNSTADMLQEHQQRKAHVRSAMYYPLFVLGLGFLTVIVMLTFVVPRLSGLFTEFGARLPLSTRILMHVSGFFAAYGIVLLIIAGAAAYGVYLWNKSPDGKRKIDQLSLNIPFYGPWVMQMESVKVFKTLAMLLGQGVSIVPAFTAICEVTDNAVLREKLKHILEKVKEGKSLAQSLEKSRWFDDVLIGAMDAGEVSGSLVEGLNRVVQLYEQESANRGEVFLSLLGPALLVIIIGIVGFIVMALLMPIVEANFLMGA